MEGFFSGSKIRQVKKPLPLLAHCGDCGLYKAGCKSPKMVPSGKGKRKIMIIGEAPGADEDRQGEPFVGKTGQNLRMNLRKVGIDPNQDCIFTNALICRPPNNKIKDEKAVEYCRPNVLRVIEEHKPRVIILLGKQAVKSVIGFLWKEEVGAMDRWLGWQIPSQRFNAWICPTWHPSYLMRKKSQVADMMFLRHLKAATKLDYRPWRKIPDYKAQIVNVLDPDKAADLIDSMVKKGRPLAFDYEANCLKPDSSQSRIVCCSVSDGRLTIAFPWTGRAVQAMKRLIRSKSKKIASNMKFEERWTRAKLGLSVRNWDHDTMLAAHVLDNREGICSIKFQAFVLLGQESYDDHIKPYLQSKEKGCYSLNRIDRCDLDDLMTYCGLDSLLEWKVARIHKRHLRRDEKR